MSIRSETIVTDCDIFFFDLRGYLFLEGALSAQEVADMNAVLDSAPLLAPGDWWGNVHAHSYRDNDGSEPSADL